MKDDDELFAALYPSLRRFAAVVRPAEEDADDLVQDALARALALGPLSTREDPAAYLRRAIVRIASNHRRRLARGRRALLRAQPLIQVTCNATYPSALAELQRLSPFDRAVLFLSVVEQRPYREIAATLGCGESAARARASRALRRLRELLQDENRGADD